MRPPSLALASITTEEGSGREQVGNVSEEAVVEEITKVAIVCERTIPTLIDLQSHRLIDLCSVALKGTATLQI